MTIANKPQRVFDRLPRLVRRSVWLPLGKYFLITYDPFYHRKTWQTLIGVEKFKGENSTDIWIRIYKVAFAICKPNAPTQLPKVS